MGKPSVSAHVLKLLCDDPAEGVRRDTCDTRCPLRNRVRTRGAGLTSTRIQGAARNLLS